jgi:hypothetical protein
MSGGHATREVISWAVRDVEEECEAGRLDVMDKISIRDQILRLRGAAGTLYDYAGLPMPFFYAHLITINSGLYMTLFAYGVAVDVEQCPSPYEFSRVVCHVSGFVTGSLAIAAVSLSIIGLQKAASQLSDPFGNDLVDFKVLSWITGTLESTRRVVSRPYREPFSFELEESLEQGAYAAMKTEDDPDKKLYHIGVEKFLRAKDTKAPGFTTRADKNLAEKGRK